MIFYEFIWIHFESKRIKNRFLWRANVGTDVAWTKKASPCSSVGTRHMARVCVCAHV